MSGLDPCASNYLPVKSRVDRLTIKVFFRWLILHGRDDGFAVENVNTLENLQCVVAQADMKGLFRPVATYLESKANVCGPQSGMSNFL